MFKEKTHFTILPNEIIYYIFNYLTYPDIIQAFIQLNCRYKDVVRFYVKQIDLTHGWLGDQQALKEICKIIHTIKVDRLNLHLLIDYQFLELYSLNLMNVSDWYKVTSRMNLKNLCLWFDDDTRHFHEKRSIPQTVIQFSSNVMFDAHYFHTNLLDLNVRVWSLVHLLEIVQRTPDVQHLSVTFAYNFSQYYNVKNYKSDLFETMTTNFNTLSNLSDLYFSTNDGDNIKSNERLPFKQIKDFINLCCPNKMILKRVSLKFHHIFFDEDIWSTIVQYKKTYDRFDFYGSFIVNENDSKIEEIALCNDNFDFRTEGIDPSHPHGQFVHIYTLPFTFDKLHGFTFCSLLSSQHSFSTVRHLYLTQTYVNPIISMESLAKRLPNLISIHCRGSSQCFSLDTVPKPIVDKDILNHVRSLFFEVNCWSLGCNCYSILPRLLNRMPHLESLTTLNRAFTYVQHPLMSIKQFHLQGCYYASFDSLTKYVPNVSTLLLTHMRPKEDLLSRSIRNFFTKLSYLTVISLQISESRSYDPTPYKKIAEKTLARLHAIDDRFKHMRLAFEDGRMEFSFPNS